MNSIHSEKAVCPLYTAISVIDGRWKPMLFQRLSEQPRGLRELQRSLPGISRKVLIEQLRQMTADDLIDRLEIGDRLGSVEYRVTSYGLTLGPIFTSLWTWGSAHLDRSTASSGTLVSAPRTAIARL